MLARARKLFLLIRMAGWVALVTAAARLVPLPRALGLTEPRRRGVASRDPHEIARLLRRILVFDPTCWKRAAVLRRYLLLSGIETTVVFGVRRDGAKVEGHAWLERDGAPYLEGEPPRYAETWRYPP